MIANDQRAISAGVRWDFAKNAALKLQLDDVQVRERAGGNGYFINIQPGFSPGSASKVVSVVLDFAF
ncbi:hypothetical protein [Noviherbaspirillum saxi]|uniref:Porin n=1 Tax=Noviherbaspirillum saxi TaxID=2320863 RepID=A0A3A3FL63_9BURK|nr:hypothetical protein [Noviherbaspirillum saxi]RJF92252.1 hypothetical protein D3871_26850 [Noviherbaspirillum saxi]